MHLQRSKKYSIGKTIGSNTWVHKQYETVFPKAVLQEAKKHLPKDFDYTVVKYDSKAEAVSFIQSPDFNSSSEPLVGDVIRISSDGAVKKIRSGKNPMIYHHKWLMVDDDYRGFDVEQSVIRSSTWKTLIGVNREISSRIGRRNYWLDEIVPKIVEDDTKRSGRTAMTRSAISKPTRTLLLAGYVQGSVLHHGCGKALDDSQTLREIATEYAEFDPTYAPDRSVLGKKYTTIISNYVMNTLPKEARLLVWRDLARCTGGNTFITIRQDDIRGEPFKDGILTSKKTFQVFIPKDDFVMEAKDFFSKVDVLHKTSALLMLKCR
jgi:hypothetical protein